MDIRTSEFSGMVVRDIEMLFKVGTVAGQTDGQLLARFTHRRDDEGQAAFAALVRRHGPMVLRVCSGVLRNMTDIEDAFQATFLVLARKAGSIREPNAVGSWLYGVALRIASKQRAAAIRRRDHERRFAAITSAAETEEARHDLELALLEEVDRLPETYRAPIVLCYLEGLTHEAAARRLSWPLGTVEGRLARARGLLKSRLTRRGLAPALGLLATTASAEAAEAGLSRSCVDAVTGAARSFAVENAEAACTVPARAAMLAREVLFLMRLGAIKTAVAVLLIGALAAAFMGVYAFLSQDSRLLAGQKIAKAQAQPAPAPAGPLKVVILQGATSGWESRYIARALSAVPDIQLEMLLVRRPVRDGNGELDDSVFNLGKYAVYILTDLPANALTSRQQERLRLLVVQGAGLIMLGGHSSFGAGGWADTPVARVLPVEIRAGDGVYEPEGGLKFVLTPDGRKRAFLQVGPTETDSVQIWDHLPPISDANRFGPIKPLAVILAETRDHDLLMITQDVGKGRVLLFGGQTWMWARSGDEGQSTHRKFWRQVIRWVGRQMPPHD
jgi:RNA polymerase sigma factor (sigma-70 family)